jgi:hypothetical protein
MAAMADRAEETLFPQSNAAKSFEAEITVVWDSLVRGSELNQLGGRAICHLSDGFMYEFTRGLTSKSCRVAMATDLADRPDVRTRFIGERGNWKLEGIATLFSYKRLTPTGDFVCALALSEWPTVDGGNIIVLTTT